MRERSHDQKFADELDCDLFRMIRKVEQAAKQDKHWCKVVEALRNARPHIRVRMHDDDRAVTSSS